MDFDDELDPIDGPLVDFTVYNPSLEWAAGNLISDIDDIARFYRGLLRGKILSSARLAAMKAAVETGLPDVGYGLGLFAYDTPCGTLFGHDGGLPGFVNASLSSEDGSRQVGLMMNVHFAPTAVFDAFNLAIQQAVADGWAGTPCAEAPAGIGGRGELRAQWLR